VSKARSTNRVKRAAGGLYAWLWWHTEFWLDGEARRPFTYIMRDVYHSFPLLVIIALGGLFYALGRWWFPVGVIVFSLGFIALLVGTLLGHLFWAGKWVPGQQEEPTYNPDTDK
jgi:hypothetical protein